VTDESPRSKNFARIGLIVSLLLAAAIRIPHLNFVPIWDGRQYWDFCAQPALSSSFNPLAFNCFGHRSMAYMIAVTWPQYFSQGSALLLNLAHLAVALLTILAFHKIARRLFPSDRSNGIAPAMLTILFAAMPIWTGASLNLNPDVGVLLGFLWCIAFLLDGRRMAGVGAGIFLVLSKEIGLLLWILIAVVETALAALQEKEWNARFRLALKRCAYVVPLLAYYLTGLALRSNSMPASWPNASREPSLLRIFLSFDLSAPHYLAYVADIFVINFAWVMTIVILAWLILVVVRILGKRGGVPVPEEIDPHTGVFLAVITPCVLFLVTRFPTFNNPRYLLPAFPLMVLAFGVAIMSLFRSRRTHAIAVVIAAALQLASMWSTIDPVSRFVFGTFDFGDHPMLRMTSIRGECCGMGRDQLVYNLQYTHFDSIQKPIFEAIKPRDHEQLAIASTADWYLIGHLDALTKERTLRNTGVIDPDVLTLLKVLNKKAELPDEARYIAFSNVDNAKELRLYSRAYRISRPVIVEEHGYRAAIFGLKRRVVAE
jgi:hypothetical protein